MFFCSICHPKATLSLKFFDEIQDKHHHHKHHLSKRGSFPSSIYVKPDLTREERAFDSAFLKVRCLSGTDKKCIKLRGNNIYINKLLSATLTSGASVATNIVNSSLSNPQDSDSIQLVSIPTIHHQSASSNSEPMITTALSAPNTADSFQATTQAKSNK